MHVCDTSMQTAIYIYIIDHRLQKIQRSSNQVKRIYIFIIAYARAVSRSKELIEINIFPPCPHKQYNLTKEQLGSIFWIDGTVAKIFVT